MQRDVLISLGLIVAIYLLQPLIQQTGKLCQVVRRLGELNNPLVATLGIGIHKDWSSCVFQNLSTRLFTGIGQSLLGIVDDQFFAKSIDKALGASRDDELIRIGRSEADGIAYHIAPQATRSGNQHGVVLVFLNTPQRHYLVLCAFSVELLELVEHSIVQHQQHGLVGRVVL